MGTGERAELGSGLQLSSCVSLAVSFITVSVSSESVGPQPLKERVLGGKGSQRAGRFRDTQLGNSSRCLGIGEVAPVWSSTSFFNFRIMSKAGPGREGPCCKKSAGSFRIQGTPARGCQLSVYRQRQAWLHHPLKHPFTLAGSLWGD